VFVRYYVGRLVASLNCRYSHLFKLQRQPRKGKGGGGREEEGRSAASGGFGDWHCSTIFNRTKFSKLKPSELFMASVKIGPILDVATG
jgi:hypothetical protein